MRAKILNRLRNACQFKAQAFRSPLEPTHTYQAMSYMNFADPDRARKVRALS